MNSRFFAICLCLLCARGFAQQQVTVQEAILTALQKSYDVRVVQNNAAVAFSDSRYSMGLLLPTINLDGTLTSSNTNRRTVNASDQEKVTNGLKSTILNANARLVWTLFDGTRMFATRKRLDLAAEQGELAVRNQMNNTVAAVVNNYYNIVRQKQQLKAIQEQLAVSEERVKLAERKLQVGTGGKPELLQARVDLNAFRANALAQEALIRQLKDQLNALLALELPDNFDTSDSIELNLSMDMDAIMADLENSNFGLRLARKQVEVAKATLWENRAGRSPIVNFNALYNFNRNESNAAESNVSLVFSRNYGFNYGLSVSVPILNRFNVTNAINIAEINLNRQDLIYQQQRALVQTGIRVAFVNYDNARKVLVIEEENILLARENVTIMFESFKRGIATFIELRTAQQSLQDAYNRLIAARYTAKLAEIELLRLKGALIE